MDGSRGARPEDEESAPLQDNLAQPQSRNSFDLEQEYLKTLRASKSQFSFSRYEDFVPSTPPSVPAPVNSNAYAPASAPTSDPSHSRVAPAPPPSSSSQWPATKSQTPFWTSGPPQTVTATPSRALAPNPSPALPFALQSEQDYVSPEERARLCAEDMRQVGLREPRAAWYPTQTALFENLTPSRTTSVKTTISAQPPPVVTSEAPPAEIFMTALPASQVEAGPAAGVVTSVRKAGSWGAVGANPIETFRNIPVRQHYDLTQLKRSNVRTNDELTPKPTHVNMGPQMIEKPFPAEHPYASHEPRLAIFPKFGDSPDDPRAGVRAREQLPKHADVPSKSFDLRIISKTKGSGLHHVEQSVPPDSKMAALQWPGDRYEQMVKGEHRPKQNFYPTPPKLVQPNMEPRGPERSVSDLTADTLRNVERDQWRSHYNMQYTGLGTANVAALTNLDEKRVQTLSVGAADDDLKVRSVRTFDPPRPVEGRIARHLQPRPPMPAPTPANPNRKPTLTEVEDDRLLNGKKYASLPETAFDRMVQDQQWRILELGKAPEQGVERLQALRGSAPAQLSTPAATELGPEARRQVTFKEQVQQMEAQDRWRVLEAESPAQDVSQLRHKYRTMGPQPSAESPRVFFDHEGRFQEERAGLYRTSYDPQLLRHAMPGGAGANGAGLFDTSQSHEGAYLGPSPLNRAVSLPNLGRCGNDLVMHQMQKENQRAKLEPTAEAASIRVQEGGHVINRESEHGTNFNIDKFLQEYELPRYARVDPARTFGRDGDLASVQPACQPRLGSPNRAVHFSNDVMVATGYGNEPIHLTSAALNDGDEGYHSGSAGESQETEGRRRRGPARRMLLPEEARLVAHQQSSLASTFQSGGPQELLSTSRSQFPPTLALQPKEDDPRFRWEPNQGSRWPQSRLLDLQHSFDRSEVRRRFHEQFSERNPDLRENVILGKRHDFAGVNSQVIRG